MSHPLIFHPYFLAMTQMQGQHSLFDVRRNLTQLMSACWSAPFYLAALSQSLMAYIKKLVPVMRSASQTFSFSAVQAVCAKDRARIAKSIKRIFI